MRLALTQHGITAGVRRLRRVMRENGWLHERGHRPKGLTKASSEVMLAENLIRQDFSADKPCQKLLTDRLLGVLTIFKQGLILGVFSLRFS